MSDLQVFSSSYMGDPLVASLVGCLVDWLIDCTFGLTTFEIVAAQKKGFFLYSFLQIWGEVCTSPYVSSRQCDCVICRILQNPWFFKTWTLKRSFRLLPGPRHGSLAFMLAAEVGFYPTSGGIVLILQREATGLQNVQGYDVWLGNFRGNHESREHVNLDPDVDSDYWQFSWDEMAK